MAITGKLFGFIGPVPAGNAVGSRPTACPGFGWAFARRLADSYARTSVRALPLAA